MGSGKSVCKCWETARRIGSKMSLSDLSRWMVSLNPPAGRGLLNVGDGCMF